jgi:hypothetical protein
MRNIKYHFYANVLPATIVLGSLYALFIVGGKLQGWN